MLRLMLSRTIMPPKTMECFSCILLMQRRRQLSIRLQSLIRLFLNNHSEVNCVVVVCQVPTHSRKRTIWTWISGYVIRLRFKHSREFENYADLLNPSTTQLLLHPGHEYLQVLHFKFINGTTPTCNNESN